VFFLSRQPFFGRTGRAGALGPTGLKKWICQRGACERSGTFFLDIRTFRHEERRE